MTFGNNTSKFIRKIKELKYDMSYSFFKKIPAKYSTTG
jgi:hypothetical protein